MINSSIAPSDSEILADVYESSPDKFPDLTSEQFLENIDWRIYTEWCMDTYRGPSAQWTCSRHQEYEKNTPIAQWIAEETHFAIERLMQDGQNITEEVRDATRTRVVQAIAQRAMELFGTWKEHQWPSKDDPRNLRVSLAPYLMTKEEMQA